MPHDTRAQVRGRAFLGLINQLRELGGKNAIDEMLRKAPVETRRLFEERLRQSAWYPYAAYVGMLRTSDQVFGKGNLELCRSMGAHAANIDMGTMFQIYAKIASPERMLNACRIVWPQYYRDAGTMRASHTSSTDSRICIDDFPEMDPAHCRLMEGWMVSAIEKLGVKIRPGATETRCPSRGDAFHEFSGKWDKL